MTVISILNYLSESIDIIYVDPDKIKTLDNIEDFLEEQGYKLGEISYMISESKSINEIYI